FGRAQFFVTRLAINRVKRGLPQSLQRCGYKSFTLYPAYGAFLGAQRFQASLGVQKFFDSFEMGATYTERDQVYYDKALGIIEREKSGSPLFLFLYTTANHFPWDYTFRPELTPNWQGSGNKDPEVEEYLRRQWLSAQDYGKFKAELKRRFGNEPFLIIRFGD